MKYLKPYNESNQSFNLDDIKYITKDALIDLIQAGMEIYVDCDPNRKDIVRISINRGKGNNLFSFNDIKDPINTLISIMASDDYELESAKYYMNGSRPGFTTKTFKWFHVSMDPIEGEVNGDEIIKFKHIDSNKKEIATFIIEFDNCKLTNQFLRSYESFSSDSDAWQIYKPSYNVEEFEDIIKGRLIEIDDNGFDINVSYNYKSITVRIEKPQKRFLLSEILEDVMSLISHMNSGWGLSVGVKFDPNNGYNNIIKLNYGYVEGYIDQLKYLSTNYVNGIMLEFHQRTNRYWRIKNSTEGELDKSNESINPYEDIKSDIEDILRDVEDEGIRVDVHAYKLGEEVVYVFLTNTKEHPVNNLTAPDTIDYITIKPNIEHLISYLEEKGYRISSIYNILELKPISIDLESLQDDTKIGRLELRFSK